MNTLVILSGDNQSVALSGVTVPGGLASFAPLAVQLNGQDGAPLAGQQIVFSAPSGGAMAAQVNPGGGSSASLTTGGDGRAVLDGVGGSSVIAYYASGPLPIVVSADNADPVTFNLTVLDAAPPPTPLEGAVMHKGAGDGQTVPRLDPGDGIPKAYFAPLSVSLADSSGNPLPNAQVTWSCSGPQGMAFQPEPVGGSTTVTVTDPGGNSTLDKMGGSSICAYYADGPFSVTASYGAANVTFNLVVGG